MLIPVNYEVMLLSWAWRMTQTPFHMAILLLLWCYPDHWHLCYHLLMENILKTIMKNILWIFLFEKYSSSFGLMRKSMSLRSIYSRVSSSSESWFWSSTKSVSSKCPELRPNFLMFVTLRLCLMCTRSQRRRSHSSSISGKGLLPDPDFTGLILLTYLAKFVFILLYRHWASKMSRPSVTRTPLHEFVFSWGTL